MLLLPGDVIATRGTSWVSKAIRFFSRGIGEPRTKTNHVAIVTRGGSFLEAVIVEALSKVLRHKLWMKYGPPGGDEIAVFRNMMLNEAQRDMIAAKARTYIGRKYGYLKIVTHVLDYALFGLYVFRRLARAENYPICSWLVAKAYAELAQGYFGVSYAEATPDHIWDYCGASPDWVQLRPMSKLTVEEAAL